MVAKKTAKKTANKTAKKTANKTAKKTAKKAAPKKTARKEMRKPAKKPAKKPARKPAARKSARKVTKKPAAAEEPGPTVGRFRLLNTGDRRSIVRVKCTANGKTVVLDKPFAPPLPPDQAFNAPPPPLPAPPVIDSIEVQVTFADTTVASKLLTLPTVTATVFIDAQVIAPDLLKVCVEWPWPGGGNQVCA